MLSESGHTICSGLGDSREEFFCFSFFSSFKRKRRTRLCSGRGRESVVSRTESPEVYGPECDRGSVGGKDEGCRVGTRVLNLNVGLRFGKSESDLLR